MDNAQTPVTQFGGSSPQKDRFSIHETFQASLEAAVPFVSVRDLFEAIDATLQDDDANRMNHVSPCQLNAIFTEREKRGGKFRLCYAENACLLMVTIPTGRHESTSRYLYSEVAHQLMDMSLFHELVPRGSEKHSARRPGGMSGQAEADESGAPRTRPGNTWPTLVIAVGFTQSLAEMRAKA